MSTLSFFPIELFMQKCIIITGMVVLIVIVLFSLTLAANMKRFQFEQLSTKDERLNKIVEAVTHLKIIKLLVWEEPFQQQVEELRIRELAYIRCFMTLQAVQNFVWNCAVFLLAFTSFTTYSLCISESLSVETAFVSLALLNALRSSFRLMPSCVTSLSQASISIERIGMYSLHFSHHSHSVRKSLKKVSFYKIPSFYLQQD